jgi:hypothetical protein
LRGGTIRFEALQQLRQRMETGQLPAHSREADHVEENEMTMRAQLIDPEIFQNYLDVFEKAARISRNGDGSGTARGLLAVIKNWQASSPGADSEELFAILDRIHALKKVLEHRCELRCEFVHAERINPALVSAAATIQLYAPDFAWNRLRILARSFQHERRPSAMPAGVR